MDEELFNLIVDSKKPLWVIKRKNVDIKVYFNGTIEGIESPHDDPIFGYNLFISFIAHLLRMIKHYCPPNKTESLREQIAKFDSEDIQSDETRYQEITQNLSTNKNSGLEL